MSERADETPAPRATPQPASPPAAAPASGAKGGAASPSPDTPPLTAEEQMEKFAQDLKENDWGHQPC